MKVLPQFERLIVYN